MCIDLTSPFPLFFFWLFLGAGECDCRDEIQRIKAGNPDISHREAFSAAAKNVSAVSLLFSRLRSFSFFLNFFSFF